MESDSWHFIERVFGKATCEKHFAVEQQQRSTCTDPYCSLSSKQDPFSRQQKMKMRVLRVQLEGKAWKNDIGIIYHRQSRAEGGEGAEREN